MARLVAHVLEEPLPPTARVVVSLLGAGRPVLSGGGRDSVRCGACSEVIARKVDGAALAGLVLRCSSCCRHVALD